MLSYGVAVVADHEWWERLRDRWLAWLGDEPGRLKKFVVANVVAVVAVVVASSPPSTASDGASTCGCRVWRCCSGGWR